MDRVIVYIDGFNLYFGLKSKGWRRYFWLNPQRLTENLLKPGQKLVFTKYFTARVSNNPRNPDKHKRQATFLEAIETLPDTRIYYGHYLPKPQTCFKCGATWNAHEEKRVRRSSIYRDGTSQSPSRTRNRRVDLLRRPRPPRGPANTAGPRWLDASRGEATADYAPSLRSPWRAADDRR